MRENAKRRRNHRRCPEILVHQTTDKCVLIIPYLPAETTGLYRPRLRGMRRRYSKLLNEGAILLFLEDSIKSWSVRLESLIEELRVHETQRGSAMVDDSSELIVCVKHTGVVKLAGLLILMIT
jgi:hypothetical protein